MCFAYIFAYREFLHIAHKTAKIWHELLKFGISSA